MIRSLGDKTPEIHPDAWVSEAAYVVGDVKIGARSSVWPMAVVRGDFMPIVIGENTHVEDGAVIHVGDLGDNVTVGHCAVIHCKRIGSNVLIGNNATVLDGAEIGNFCLIAAGAVVPPNLKAPDRSFLVGLPATVRPISEEQLKTMEWFLRGYAESAARYKAAGL